MLERLRIMLARPRHRLLRWRVLHQMRPRQTPQQVWDDRVLHDADALAVLTWGTKKGAVTDSRTLAATWRDAARRMTEPSAYRPWTEPTGDAIRAASVRRVAIASATQRFYAGMESPEMPGPGYDARSRRIEPEVCHCGHSQLTCTL